MFHTYILCLTLVFPYRQGTCFKWSTCLDNALFPTPTNNTISTVWWNSYSTHQLLKLAHVLHKMLMDTGLPVNILRILLFEHISLKHKYEAGNVTTTIQIKWELPWCYCRQKRWCFEISFYVWKYKLFS